MPDRKEINKRGYLKEDFRLFHLKDSRAQKVDYHYHAFDKLILLLGGKVTYVVEGVTYFLQPWDLLLVGHDLIHRPIIDPAEPYERVVIWLGREWLERRSDPGEALDTCFDTTRERGFHLLRFDAERRLHYMQRIQQLEEALRDRSFGAARMADTLCQQMLIDVNRDVLRSRTAQEERDSYRVDPKMEEVLRYILDHLGEELTVESLSKRFFISRYYLMHRFKAVTGYTVHQYISQKRLLRAGELIRAGVPVMKAAEQAGFEDSEAAPRLLAIWERYVSEKPRPGYRPLALSYSAQGTYNGERFLDAEQLTRNKLCIYTREKNTGFDRRFLMKRVDGSWKIDAVQERLDGWQRVGL